MAAFSILGIALIIAVLLLIIFAAVKKIYVLIPSAVVALLVWYIFGDIVYVFVAFFVILVLSVLFKK